MRAAPVCALSLAAVASACGPVSLDQAEAECFRQAQLASRPRGTVGLGISSGGQHIAKGQVEISSDWLTGRDPSQVYASCVQRESGQPPRRPLYDRPDWKG